MRTERTILDENIDLWIATVENDSRMLASCPPCDEDYWRLRRDKANAVLAALYGYHAATEGVL